MVAGPAAASQDIWIKAANAQADSGETVTLEVAVANGHEHAPAKNVTVAVETGSENLEFTRQNATVSVEAKEVKVVTFEAAIAENAEPGNYTVTAEALRGENPIDNTTAVVTVADPSAERGTGGSGDESTASDETRREAEEECTTINDWVAGEIEFGEWDHWWDCSDDDVDDDYDLLDWFFDWL